MAARKKSATDEDAIVGRVREICLRLPEVSERLSHGSPSFFVREKRTLASVDAWHHGVEHIGIWCPAPAGVQEEMIAEDPVRFFRPPYVGPSGWLGVRLAGTADGRAVPPPDWIEVEEILRDAYRKVAPKTLVRELDGTVPPPA